MKLPSDEPMLVIEAATTVGSVALLRGNRVDAVSAVTMGAGTADELFPAVRELLGQSGMELGDLGAIACGSGPGSFTSLRIAAALSKGLAQGLDIPLHSVSSLAIAAAGSTMAGSLVVHSDALRGERYVQQFIKTEDGFVNELGPIGRVSVDELLANSTAAQRVAVMSNHESMVGESVVIPSAAFAAMVAGEWRSTPVDISSWEPSYGRLAEAQVKWEATHGRRLPLDVGIRPMRLEDVAEVVAIEHRSFGDPWPASAFRELLTRDYVRARVAFNAAGSILGYCVVIAAADEREVANICVDSAVRGRGVAGQLLDDALREADRDCASAAYLEVRVSNSPAIRLYESRGFSTVGRRRGYYQNPDEDALVLRRTGQVAV